MDFAEQLDDITKNNLNYGTALPVRQIDTVAQDRLHFDEDDIKLLAGSIKSQGLKIPITVIPTENGRYSLNQGERRLRAYRYLEIELIPAVILDKHIDPKKAAWSMLIENVARKDLTLYEKAVAFNKRINDYASSPDEIADSVGVSAGYVRKILGVLNYPIEVQHFAKERIVNDYSHLNELNKLFKESPNKLKNILADINDGMGISGALTRASQGDSDVEGGDEEGNASGPQDADEDGLPANSTVSVSIALICQFIARQTGKPIDSIDPQNPEDVSMVKSKLKKLEKKLVGDGNGTS